MVVVRGDSIEEHDGATSDASDWLGEAFVHSLLQATGIERIEVGVERSISTSGYQVVVGSRMETFSKEIANMAQANKNKIADIC